MPVVHLKYPALLLFTDALHFSFFCYSSILTKSLTELLVVVDDQVTHAVFLLIRDFLAGDVLHLHSWDAVFEYAKVGLQFRHFLTDVTLRQDELLILFFQHLPIICFDLSGRSEPLSKCLLQYSFEQVVFACLPGNLSTLLLIQTDQVSEFSLNLFEMLVLLHKSPLYLLEMIQQSPVATQLSLFLNNALHRISLASPFAQLRQAITDLQSPKQPSSQVFPVRHPTEAPSVKKSGQIGQFLGDCFSSILEKQVSVSQNVIKDIIKLKQSWNEDSIVRAVGILSKVTRGTILQCFDTILLYEKAPEKAPEKAISAGGGSSQKRRSDSQEEINLELTLKSKVERSSSFKAQDSLMYSNEIFQPVQQKLTKPKQQSQSSISSMDRASSKDIKEEEDRKQGERKQEEDQWEVQQQAVNRIKNASELDKYIQEQDYQITAPVAIIESPSKKKRGNHSMNNLPHTLPQKKYKEIGHIITETPSLNQVNQFKIRITKLKQLKQAKKKKLQQQLWKVNQQIEEIKTREKSLESPTKPYESRLKIADDIEAKNKAERFVKNLRSQKRSRQAAKIDEFTHVDQNIHKYMDELMRERYKHDERTKQKKQLQIIERMKQQQLRKIEQQKKKENTHKFLAQLKASNHSSPSKSKKKSEGEEVALEQQLEKQIEQREPPEHLEHLNNYHKQKHSEPTVQRHETKKSEAKVGNDFSSGVSSLTKKKAYLHKIRNFSIKKSKVDVYQTALN